MLRIIKLGGSIITYKNSLKPRLRRSHLHKIGTIIKQWIDLNNDLIIILGTGSFGHPLAKKYSLQQGIKIENFSRNFIKSQNSYQKKYQHEQWKGALETHLSVAKLLHEVSSIFLKIGIPIYPISPLSIVMPQALNIVTSTHALETKLVPLLHGDIVFDNQKGLKIYSGDNIAIDLGKILKADEIHFATYKGGIIIERKMVEKISPQTLKNKKVTSKTDYIDVSGGFKGKIEACLQYMPPKGIRIYNGLNLKNFKNGFLNNKGGTLIIED